MTTPTKTKQIVPQKNSFNLYDGQHYRACLETLEAKRFLKAITKIDPT